MAPQKIPRLLNVFKLNGTSFARGTFGERALTERRPAAGRETDARFGRNRRERLARGLPRLFRLDEENVIDMKMLIGPLLERNGGYSYDTFTITDGLRASFRYLRLAAARYDQRALIAEARRDPACDIYLCETRSEFERLVEVARGDDEATAAGEQ